MLPEGYLCTVIHQKHLQIIFAINYINVMLFDSLIFRLSDHNTLLICMFLTYRLTCFQHLQNSKSLIDLKRKNLNAMIHIDLVFKRIHF